MDFFLVVLVLTVVVWTLKTREQAQRIALLGSHLGQVQIEKLMQTLTDGYLRCLGEPDAERRDQIWSMLGSTEETLVAQFDRFSASFARVPEAEARVSKLPVALPFMTRLLPGATFDARQAFAIHAKGIADAAANRRQQTLKAKAFTLSAELFLMQHTCHWFCRSKTVASARLLARHQTSYQLALDSVGPDTRAAYRALTGR